MDRTLVTRYKISSLLLSEVVEWLVVIRGQQVGGSSLHADMNICATAEKGRAIGPIPLAHIYARIFIEHKTIRLYFYLFKI